MSEPTERKGFSWKSGWGIAFLASIALNLFVIGVWIGNAASDAGTPGPRCGRGGDVRSFIRNNADLAELSQQIRGEMRQRFRTKGRALGEARRGLVAAVREEPFQPAGVQAAQQRLAAARAEMRVLRDEASRKFIMALQPEDRARLATHLQERADCRRRYWVRFHERADRREAQSQ